MHPIPILAQLTARGTDARVRSKPWRAWPYRCLSGAERAGIAMLHRRIRHARPNRKRPQRSPGSTHHGRPNPRTVRHPRLSILYARMQRDAEQAGLTSQQVTLWRNRSCPPFASRTRTFISTPRRSSHLRIPRSFPRILPVRSPNIPRAGVGRKDGADRACSATRERTMPRRP